jgi:ribosomal protein L30/L7E
MSGVKDGGKKGGGKKTYTVRGKSVTAKIMRRRKQFKMLQNKRPRLSVPVPEGLKKAWELKNRSMMFHRRRREITKHAMVHKRKKQAERIREYDLKYQRLEDEKKSKVLAARKAGNFYKPCDAKFAIVIRIRGINALSPKVRKVMELFRLIQIHSAVFIRLNKATINAQIGAAVHRLWISLGGHCAEADLQERIRQNQTSTGLHFEDSHYGQ